MMEQTKVKQTDKTTAEAVVGDHVGVVWSAEGELTITTAKPPRARPRSLEERNTTKLMTSSIV
jgi:hypothetical protein